MVDHIDVEEVAVRSGTAAAWAAAGAPVLGNGELGIDLDTHEVRIGDGTSAFADLPVTAGGGGAVVRKILRYDFDYTLDPDPEDWAAGTVITTSPLAEGTVIESAWVAERNSLPFEAGQSYKGLYVSLVPVGNEEAFDDFIFLDLTAQTGGAAPIGGVPLNAGTPGTSEFSLPCVVAGTDCHVAIHLESATPFTQGEATLFVLYSLPT